MGEACALLAAFTWALALVLFRRSGETIPPLALNLFKNVVSLAMLVITLLVLGGDGGLGGDFSGGSGAGLGGILGGSYALHDIAILVVSGVMGIALADTLFFYGLNLVGVGIIAIADCLYSPFVILFAFLLLGERLSPLHFLGTGMILGSVVLASRHRPPVDRSRAQIAAGVLLGAAAMAVMTFGIVIAKPVLDERDFPLIPAVTIRMLAGTLFLAAGAVALPRWRSHWRWLRPSRVWRFSLPATFLGSYLAMIFWVAGFKYARAAIAGVLNQTSTVFALVLAALFLSEPLTARKATAAAVAVAGVIIVTLA